MSARSLVIEGIGAIATMRGGRLGLLRAEDRTGLAIVVCDGHIDSVGPRAALAALPVDAEVIDVCGRAVVPGLVDCHTHAVFAGDRSDEFARRSLGESYGQIAAAGGGIRSTMRAVRAASVDELADLATPRLLAMRARGVCTVEIKSGYGLSVDDELKMLSAAQEAGRRADVDVHTTLLAAHAVPPEATSASAWIDTTIAELLPAVCRAGLATACDVFVEDGAFSVDDARRLLRAAVDCGLAAVVHAEQLSWQGGARLAAELSARSAGHLEYITTDDAAALADAGVVAEILSTAQVFLRGQRPIPARMLHDAGCTLAIGTDYNPGTAMCHDLLLAGGLAVTQCGLSADEALVAMTAGSSRALGLRDRGVVAVGARADLVVVDAPSPYALIARWGEPVVHAVIREGRLLHETCAVVATTEAVAGERRPRRPVSS
jgi:imidazolonepropionase